MIELLLSVSEQLEDFFSEEEVRIMLYVFQVRFKNDDFLHLGKPVTPTAGHFLRSTYRGTSVIAIPIINREEIKEVVVMTEEEYQEMLRTGMYNWN